MALVFPTRSRVSAIAVMTAAIVVGALAVGSYAVGRRLDPELRFLDPRRAPTIDEAGPAQSIEYALRSDEENDVVFFGDSTCRTGIDPVSFDRLTGLHSYNIGSGRGLGPNGMAVTVMAYLLHHPRPRAVVMCVTPFCFEADGTTLGGDLPDRFVASYGPEVAGVVTETETFAYFIRCGAVSILDSEAREVRDDRLVGLERETYHSSDSKLRKSRGFFGLPGDHGPQRGVGPGPENMVHEDWDRWIRRIAEVCGDVRLIVRFTPIASEYADAREFRQLDLWAARLETDHPNAVVTRPIVVPFERSLMWDSIHLNAAGVEKFMPLVAKDVQATLSHRG